MTRENDAPADTRPTGRQGENTSDNREANAEQQNAGRLKHRKERK